MKQEYDEIYQWWKKLVDKSNKGAYAKLRRCNAPEEIYLNSDYVQLHQKIGNRINGLNYIAGLLAHIKEIDGVLNEEYMAKQMSTGADRPIISETRFRRLLSCEIREELYPLLQRSLKILIQNNMRINLIDLIDSIHFWGDKKKREWAEAYYSNLK